MSSFNITCETAIGLIDVFTAPQTVYSLNYRCAAEFLGTLLIVTFGDAAAANMLLPKTKGHNMGFGPISLAWGMAYFAAIMCFNYVSAYFNPVLLIGDWVLGEIHVGTFFALAACELAGAIAGAILVWLLYLPHFATQPSPPPVDASDNLLHTRDYLGPRAANYVGNKVWVNQVGGEGLLNALQYYIQDNYQLPKNELLEKVLGKDAMVTGDPEPASRKKSRQSKPRHKLGKKAPSAAGERAESGRVDVEMAPESPGAVRSEGSSSHIPGDGASGASSPKLLRRFSVQVADLHSRLAHLDEEYASLKQSSKSPTPITPSAALQHTLVQSAPVTSVTALKPSTESTVSAKGSAVAHHNMPMSTKSATHLGSASVSDKFANHVDNSGGSAVPVQGPIQGPIQGPSTNGQPEVLPQHGIEGLLAYVRSRKTLKTINTSDDGSASASDQANGDTAAGGNPPVPQQTSALFKSVSGLKQGLLGDAPSVLNLRAQELRSAEHKAAMLADQAAKLHVFCTRPSLRLPLWNFVAEFFCSVLWMFLYKMLVQRGLAIYQSAQSFWPTELAFLRGWLVFVLMVGLGGPTGFAANPARDFGPRLVHFLLPIPNKGPSEWGYAPIPVVAPLLGGLAGAGLFAAIRNLWHSSVDATAYLGLQPATSG